MSEFRFRRLERFRKSGGLSEMVLGIPAPTSASGKTDRCCPNPKCTPGRFQMGHRSHIVDIATEDANKIRRRAGENGITCPYCGTDASDAAYTCQHDVDAAAAYVRWAAVEDVKEHVGEMLRQTFGSGARPASGWGISTEYRGASSSQPEPRAWREDLLRDLTCDVCGRQYGIYAIGLFCPDCGAPNLHLHFLREVSLIHSQLELAQTQATQGHQELSYRLVGNAHEDVLTAFETYLKTLYSFVHRRRLPNEAIKKLGNKFQNVDRTRQLFGEFNVDPFESLSDDDLSTLRLNIEKRHVIGHNLGIADDRYLDASDTDKVGQTVTLLAEEVQAFAQICTVVILDLGERLEDVKTPPH